MMSDERFKWLREYFAPLPRDVAPVTHECIAEIASLRERILELEEQVKEDEAELNSYRFPLFQKALEECENKPGMTPSEFGAWLDGVVATTRTKDEENPIA